MSQKVRQMSTNATICNCFSIKLAAPNASAVWAKLQKFGKRESTVWRTWRLNYSEEFAIFAITPLRSFLMAKFLKNEVHYKVNANFASRKAKYWFLLQHYNLLYLQHGATMTLKELQLLHGFWLVTFLQHIVWKSRKKITLYKSILWFSNSVLPEFAFLVSTVYAMLPCCDSVWLP